MVNTKFEDIFEKINKLMQPVRSNKKKDPEIKKLED
jgi:hypothetical protein